MDTNNIDKLILASKPLYDERVAQMRKQVEQLTNEVRLLVNFIKEQQSITSTSVFRDRLYEPLWPYFLDDISNQRSVYIFICKNYVDGLRWLLNKGLNPNGSLENHVIYPPAPGPAGWQGDSYPASWTLLHEACYSSMPDMVHLLLQYGASVHRADSDGLTVLQYVRQQKALGLPHCYDQPSIERRDRVYEEIEAHATYSCRVW